MYFNIKIINETYYILFGMKSSKSDFYIYSTFWFAQATFQVLHSHMWPVATTLDHAALELSLNVSSSRPVVLEL